MSLNVLIVTSQHEATLHAAPLPYQLARAFVRAGHDVQVVALDWATGAAPTREYRDPSGFRVLYVTPRAMTGLGAGLRRLTKWLFTPIWSYFEVRRAMRGRTYDLVIGFSIASSLVGPFAWGWRHSRRSYLYVTDFFPYHHRAIGVVPGGVIFSAARMIENAVFRGFDVIGCMSAAGVGYLRRRYRLAPDQDAVVLPLWTDTEPPATGDRDELRKALGLPQRRPIVLFGGNISEGRGIEEILAAAALGRARKPELLFLFVGRGSLDPLVRAYIAQGGDNVAIRDPMDRMDYLKLASICDVGLVATVAGVDVPTFPSKTLDYLIAGIPIAASVERTTDYSDFVRERGFGVAVEAGDAARLLSAILAIVNEPAQADRMTDAGRKTLDEVFDVERAVGRIIDQSGLASRTG